MVKNLEYVKNTYYRMKIQIMQNTLGRGLRLVYESDKPIDNLKEILEGKYIRFKPIQFAKMNGCAGMSIAGRPGWQKILGKRGWDVAFVNLSKEF